MVQNFFIGDQGFSSLLGISEQSRSLSISG